MRLSAARCLWAHIGSQHGTGHSVHIPSFCQSFTASTLHQLALMILSRSLEDPDRAPTAFVSSLDTPLGGPGTPLGGSGSGPVGGGASDSLSGLIGALPGLSAAAGRSAEAAGFSGGLPPPAPGLLDDPWGQLSGLSLPATLPQVRSSNFFRQSCLFSPALSHGAWLVLDQLPL